MCYNRRQFLQYIGGGTCILSLNFKYPIETVHGSCYCFSKLEITVSTVFLSQFTDSRNFLAWCWILDFIFWDFFWHTRNDTLKFFRCFFRLVLNVHISVSFVCFSKHPRQSCGHVDVTYFANFWQFFLLLFITTTDAYYSVWYIELI